MPAMPWRLARYCPEPTAHPTGGTAHIPRSGEVKRRRPFAASGLLQDRHDPSPRPAIGTTHPGADRGRFHGARGHGPLDGRRGECKPPRVLGDGSHRQPSHKTARDLFALPKGQGRRAARGRHGRDPAVRREDSVDRAGMLSEGSSNVAKRFPSPPARPEVRLLPICQTVTSSLCHRASCTTCCRMMCCDDRLNSPRPSSRRTNCEVRVDPDGEGHLSPYQALSLARCHPQRVLRVAAAADLTSEPGRPTPEGAGARFIHGKAWLLQQSARARQPSRVGGARQPQARDPIDAGRRAPGPRPPISCNRNSPPSARINGGSATRVSSVSGTTGKRTWPWSSTSTRASRSAGQSARSTIST